MFRLFPIVLASLLGGCADPLSDEALLDSATDTGDLFASAERTDMAIPDACPYVGVLSRGCWLLDEASGVSAADGSGWGNHGTYTSGPTLNGVCASFDGVNDHVAVPYGSAYNITTSNLTFSAWVYPDSVAGVKVIVDHRSSSPRGYELFLYNGKPGIQLADSSGYSNFVSSTALTAGVWHHVVVSVDRTSATGLVFYVNGAQVGAAQNPTARTGSLSNTNGLTIGRTTVAAGSYFPGDLCNVAVYKSAFTAAQAASQFAMGR